MPRKQKKYHYIYKTTCQITGKFYVGMHSTDDLEDGYLGSGKILGYSRAKHGDETHMKEIIEFVESREALKLREKEIVNEELLAHPLNINLKYGGEGGGIFYSTRQLSNASIAGNKSIKRQDAEYRKKLSDAAIKAHREGRICGFTFHEGMLGKTHSPITRIKMSRAQSGNSNSQFGTCWISNPTGAFKVKKEDLDDYLTRGYHKGRKF